MLKVDWIGLIAQRLGFARIAIVEPHADMSSVDTPLKIANRFARHLVPIAIITVTRLLTIPPSLAIQSLGIPVAVGTGVGVALLAVFGRGYWPALLVTGWLAGLITERNPLDLFMITAGGTSAAVF